jgi:hypothetical protein
MRSNASVYLETYDDVFFLPVGWGGGLREERIFIPDATLLVHGSKPKSCSPVRGDVTAPTTSVCLPLL